MTSRTSWLSTPSRKIFTGGMRTPSPKIVFAPVGSAPGSGPPASIWWPNMLAQPISSSPQKIGRHTSQSLMCEIEPPHLYGSLVRITSPGRTGSVDGVEHLRDVGAELADDHAALRVGDHRELVVLLPDHGAHGRAEEHGVHLEAGALQGSLDDVERDRIDLDLRDVCDLDAVHRHSSVGLMIRFR